MKEKKIAIMAWAVMLSASVFADVYYNNKTFTESESTEGNVYIGHTNAEDGGTASDALVTVKNGATWNIDGTGECPIYIGNVSGVGRLVVEEGGQVKVVGDNKQYMIVGANNGADGVVTNKGNMVLRQLIMSVSDDSETYDNGTGTEFRKALFENFGSVVVSRNFHLGMWKGVNPSAVFYNHKGAKLEVQKADQYAFYIGGRSPACMTNAGEVVCAENGTLYIGRGIQSNGSGRLVLTENSTFKTSKNITIGGSAQGILEMSGSSTFGRSNATLKLGNSTKVKAAIEMSDNAKITVSSLNICNAQYVDAKIVLRGNSAIEHSGELIVAGGLDSTGCVEIVDHSMTSYPVNIILGNNNRALGVFRLNGTTDMVMGKEIRLGNKYMSTGRIELDGTAKLSIPASFTNVYTIGGCYNPSTGEISVSGNAELNVEGELRVGTESYKKGGLTVSGNGIVSATNVVIGAIRGVSEQDGTLVLSDSGAITNVQNVLFGRTSGSYGRCVMRGGKMYLASLAECPSTPLTVGVDADSSSGSVSGYGFVGFDNPTVMMRDYQSIGRDTWGGLYLYGKITADGMGINRDLDFSRAGVCVNQNYGKNGCGTNGWYATNKGRLLMPRSLHRATKAHATIGDYPTLSIPRLVNSFRYDFDKNTMDKTGTYVFSELYAVDRDDIPAGLPTGKGIHHSAVWRIGHFNASATSDVDDEDLTSEHKQNFSSLKLKFHYDPALAEIEDVRHVKVYRCTDSVNGGWTCVASITAPDSASPYIETAEMAPSSELWNGGWFAIVGTPRVGTVMVLR